MRLLLTRKDIALGVALSLCIIAIALQFAPAPQVTYDSRAYIEASESVDTYFNGKNADGHTYLFRPPIIPLYLHFFTDKILAAKWLNAICFVASLWLCYFIGRELKLKPVFLSLFVVSICASYPWLQNHFFVWSEPLFGTVLLLLVLVVVSGGNRGFIALLCIVLYFIRKAGVFVAGGIFLSYLISAKRKEAISAALILFSVVVFWEALIWHYSNGETTKLAYGISVVGREHYLDVVTAWVLPRIIPLAFRLVTFGISILVLFRVFRRTSIHFFQDNKIITITVLLTTYLFCFLVIGATEYNEAERYLSVMIPLAMVLPMLIFSNLESRLWARKYSAFVCCIWLAYPLGRTFYHLLL